MPLLGCRAGGGLLVVFLVLLSVTVAGGAPKPGTAATAAVVRPPARGGVDSRGGGDLRPRRRSVPINGSIPVTPAECPGLESNGRLCGKACQLRLCQALADFYKASNNVSDPWDNERGWQLTEKQSCAQLVGRAPRQAVYCSWHGITCCTPDGITNGSCWAVNTIAALELPINNINISLENPVMLPAMRALHDCGMSVLNLEANNIIEKFSDDWGRLTRLTEFNFGNCWVAGTIPNGLRRLKNLKIFDLSTNWINGTLPAWLSDLPHLQVLKLGSNSGGNEGSNLTGLLGSVPNIIKLPQLRELNLEANSLTGNLPDPLCGGDDSNLILFNVRSNKLEGRAKAVESCGNLVQLDISQNAFVGGLPASLDWDELATYRAANNNFTGRFPMTLTTARILEHLDVSYNQLTGVIPPQIALLSSLKTFVVSNNQLRGVVNENIFYIPGLSKLDLSYNQLVGTIPASIGLAYGLAEMDVSNNPGITGVLPPQMGLPSRLKTVRTVGTNVSCAGVIRPYTTTTNNSCSDPERCITPVVNGNNDTATLRCARDQLLPCFLYFSDYLVPRDDASNMRCSYIMRRTNEDAHRMCEAPASNTTLGEQAAQLPADGPDRLQQLWHIGPSYFQYQVCECLLGYTEVWLANNTILTCEPKPPQTPTAIIVGVVAAALVLLIGMLAWWQYLTTRPRWLRERILAAKRSRGAPKATKPGDKVAVSIVVTDVKDFSDLTRMYPDLMNKAMGIHNSILRKACHNHAGCIMDQEGDSWTVAFHEAEDAVAFSLQVQQALAHRSWGKPRPSQYPSDELHDLDGMRGGPLSGRFSSVLSAGVATHTSGDGSSCYGFMGEGEDSFEAGGGSSGGGPAGAVVEAGAKGQSSFTGMVRTGSSPGVAGSGASFTSSTGRISGSMDRSFTMRGPQPPGGSSGDTPALSGRLPAPLSPLGAAATAAEAMPCTASTGDMPQAAAAGDGGTSASTSTAATLSAAARVLAPFSKGGGGGAHEHHPAQRQVSFTDALMQRDANHGSHTSRVGSGQSAALVRAPSEEHTVHSSQHSGHSWSVHHPAHAQTSHGLPVVRKSSYGAASTATFSVGQGDGSMTASAAKRSSGSGSRLWNAMRRFSTFGGRGVAGGMAEVAGHHSLHLTVRIGISTGHLLYNNDLNTCAVTERAKNFVSEVANGGQVLMDEATFKAIKDSLSVLGTVGENGYDDRQLQQLLHNRVVNRLQHHISCGTCGCAACGRTMGQREASFTSQLMGRDLQDYDNDALVVHMGAFEAPEARPVPRKRVGAKPAVATAAAAAAGAAAAEPEPSPPSTPSAVGDDTGGDDTAGDDTGGEYTDDAKANGAAAAGDGKGGAAAAAGDGKGAAAGNSKAPAVDDKGASKSAAAAAAHARKQRRQLNLYAVAAPGMRRQAASTHDLTECMSWSLPVRPLPGWVQVQKGYFDAPGARQMDLSPASNEDHCQVALPDVTIVFVQVVGAPGYMYKRNRREAHGLNKAIRRCMLQMLDELQEDANGSRDGYLCRCQEADLKYMVAFLSPCKAVQWCLMVQEALMYFNWPEHVLAHAGFEEVLDPITGLPLFRGPRLRMGLAEGQPNSVLPDHAGRANYYGHAVNRAARFMDAAAHGGQVVTDVETAAKLYRSWRDEACQGVAAAEAPDSGAPSRAHSDADVAPLLMAGGSSGLEHMRHDHGLGDPMMQLMASRSLSETTGHCRPYSTGLQGRLPASRLGVRLAAQQQAWLQQRLPGQAAAAGGGANGDVPSALSSPLPAPLGPSASAQQQAAGAASGGSFTRQQQQQLQLAVTPSDGSLTRHQMLALRTSGSFTQQQQQRQQLAALGSFTRRGQVPPGSPGGPGAGAAAAPSSRAQQQQQQQQQQPATSMTASFSARRASQVAGTSTQRLSAVAAGVQPSSNSFILQVPAGWRDVVSGEVAENVTASLIGTFNFKGSGVYTMVNILHAALIGRNFPEEAPKGKGSRVMPAEGPVPNLDPVALLIPPQLLAARHAFMQSRVAPAHKAGSVA